MIEGETEHVEATAEVCGYTVARALSDNCYLVIGPAGRGVGLKRLDDDCLLKGQLHPSVKERLARVRELAHAGVANLHGVERDSGAAWLVWEYLDGRTFDDYAADPARLLRDLAVAGRELALALDLLHMQGIVHGAVHGANVVIDRGGAVRLTHVSPLLYSDPAEDARAVVRLLESAVATRGGENSALGWLLARAREEDVPLRTLAARLAALIESRELDAPPPAPDPRPTPRRLTRYAAWAVLAAGAAGGLLAWHAATHFLGARAP